jgi:hypothetical protein
MPEIKHWRGLRARIALGISAGAAQMRHHASRLNQRASSGRIDSETSQERYS